jgi:hypothetical protein
MAVIASGRFDSLSVHTVERAGRYDDRFVDGDDCPVGAKGCCLR